MSRKKKMDNPQPDDEEAVRKSEEKYRTLFNSIDEGFVIAELLFKEEDKSFDLWVLETNASFDRMMRTTDAVGKRALEIFPGAEASWFQEYARVLDTGESSRFENYLAPLERWFELYISRIGGEGSRRLAIVFNDVTSRKRAEEELRRSEERLRLIIESAKGFAIFTTDAGGIINSWHAGAAQVFGWSEAEILGQTIEVTFTPEDRAAGEPQKELETARAQGISPDVRWHLRKDGSRVFINGVVHVMRNGQMDGFLKIGRDMTAQRQAEEALRANQMQLQILNETLEQKVQEKTAEVQQLTLDLIKATQRERQRISRVLHDDLQQRVYAIQMQMSFLWAGLPEEDETGRRMISDAETELAEIVKIARSLSIDLSPPLLHGEGLSQAIKWLAIRMQEQYGLPVELQADGPFVISNEDLHVFLFNCVRELLFNVVKHAQASQAVVALAWVEDGLQIEVRDNGKGFRPTLPEDDRSKQADLPRSLGIPTIRHQISMFGGRMEIHSPSGAGTQIILIVPVRQARQAGPSPADGR
jgi:PAS domain S-box-containing protein